jgi:hypothetical protein
MHLIVRDIELLQKTENGLQEEGSKENIKIENSCQKRWIFLSIIVVIAILISLLVVFLDLNDSDRSDRIMCSTSKTTVFPITAVLKYYVNLLPLPPLLISTFVIFILHRLIHVHLAF